MKIVPRVLSRAECRAFQKRVFEEPLAAVTENIRYPRRAEFSIKTPAITDLNDEEQQKQVFHLVRTFGTMVTRLLTQRGIKYSGSRRPHDHEYVIGEALKNAIFHGSKNQETGLPDPSKTIVLRWFLEKVRRKAGNPQMYRLHLHFRDQGQGIQKDEPGRVQINSLDDVDALTPEQIEKLMSGRGFGLGKGLTGIQEIVSLRNGKEEHVTKQHRWIGDSFIPGAHTHRVMMMYEAKPAPE